MCVCVIMIMDAVYPTTVPETAAVITPSDQNNDNDESICSAQVNWELADSLLMEWNDGHVPESFLRRGSTSSRATTTTTTTTSSSSILTPQPKQYMRIYPKYHHIPDCYRSREKSGIEIKTYDTEATHSNGSTSTMSSSSSSLSPFVYCMDDAVPMEITNAIYDYTTRANLPHKTWGTYVTMKDIQKYWTNNNYNDKCTFPSTQGEGIHFNEYEKKDLDKIALPAAAYFMKHYISIHSHRNGTTAGTTFPNLFQSSNSIANSIPAATSETQEAIIFEAPSDHDRFNNNHRSVNHSSIDDSRILDEAHGIAIWALASEIGSEVPYHIDYAELFRYETGIIVPPIIAGTLHCTPNPNRTNFQGGNYCVLVRGNGLEHYRKHGYKGKIKPLHDNVNQSDCITTDSLVSDQKSKDFIEIQYQCNRMIYQSGHLPHWSTRVTAPVQPVDTTSHASHSSLTKYVRVIVGFNVFLPDVGSVIQQAPEHSDAFRRRVQENRYNLHRHNDKQLSIHAFTTNPQLRRVLVLAKREKCINDFKRRQIDLDERMQEYLRQRKCPITVNELINVFTPSDPAKNWPYDVCDVHVHIHNSCKKGTLRVTGVYDIKTQLSKLIEKNCFVECCEVKV